MEEPCDSSHLFAEPSTLTSDRFGYASQVDTYKELRRLDPSQSVTPKHDPSAGDGTFPLPQVMN